MKAPLSTVDPVRLPAAEPTPSLDPVPAAAFTPVEPLAETAAVAVA
jgi:hypothetical protein